MSNASQAQSVVFELFQDLGGFNIDDYKQFADPAAGLNAIQRFLQAASEVDGKTLVQVGDGVLELRGNGGCEERFVLERDRAINDETVSLLGLDAPRIAGYLHRFKSLDSSAIGLRVRSALDRGGVLSLWQITCQNDKGHQVTSMSSLGVDINGQRYPALEKLAGDVFQFPDATGQASQIDGVRLLHDTIEPMLHRDLLHRGLVKEGQAYQASLVGWVEVAKT